MESKVKKLYAIGNARWYDFFKSLWNKIVASEAEEQLKIFILKNLDENKAILELGCGTALNLQKIISLNIKFKKYQGIDISPDMLNIAKKKFKNIPNVYFKQSNITKLNIKEKFDIIICTWVLSHLKLPHIAVDESQKLLKPEGKMFIIFFTKPRWYVNFWLFPLAKYIFSAEPLPVEEIKKFRNVKKIHSLSANIVTAIEIYK